MRTPSFPLAGFGIELDARGAQRHFLVLAPGDPALPVSISQHDSWRESDALRDESARGRPARLAFTQTDSSIRVLLSHQQWREIASPALLTLNAHLRERGERAGRWRKGGTPLSRNCGRELLVLAWGIEMADPALIPVALLNWGGLQPIERRWLYSMVGSCPQALTLRGRGRAWRRALHALLTENPVSDERPGGASGWVQGGE